jgi:hypothetical protein
MEIHFIEIDISLFFFYSLYEKMKSADVCTLEVSSSSYVFIVEDWWSTSIYAGRKEPAVQIYI